MEICNLDNMALRGCWSITESFNDFACDLPAWEVKQLQENIANPQKLIESLAARFLVKEMVQKAGFLYEGLSKTLRKAPYFANSTYKISISHTKKYAMAILHPTYTVGIDIEQIRTQLQRIAARIMSLEELEFAQNDITRLALLWSAKETLYKIYAQRELHFIRDMCVIPFLPAQKGVFETYLFPNTHHAKKIHMEYEQIDDEHYCTWAIAAD